MTKAISQASCINYVRLNIDELNSELDKPNPDWEAINLTASSAYNTLRTVVQEIFGGRECMIVHEGALTKIVKLLNHDDLINPYLVNAKLQIARVARMLTEISFYKCINKKKEYRTSQVLTQIQNVKDELDKVSPRSFDVSLAIEVHRAQQIAKAILAPEGFTGNLKQVMSKAGLCISGEIKVEVHEGCGLDVHPEVILGHVTSMLGALNKFFSWWVIDPMVISWTSQNDISNASQFLDKKIYETTFGIKPTRTHLRDMAHAFMRELIYCAEQGDESSFNGHIITSSDGQQKHYNLNYFLEHDDWKIRYATIEGLAILIDSSSTPRNIRNLAFQSLIYKLFEEQDDNVFNLLEALYNPTQHRERLMRLEIKASDDSSWAQDSPSYFEGYRDVVQYCIDNNWDRTGSVIERVVLAADHFFETLCFAIANYLYVKAINSSNGLIDNESLSNYQDNINIIEFVMTTKSLGPYNDLLVNCNNSDNLDYPYFFIGFALAVCGNYQRALYYLDRVSNELMNDVAVLLLHAAIYVELDRSNEALDILDPLLEKFPNNYLVLCWRGAANTKMENYPFANNDLKKALRVSSEGDYLAPYFLGWYHRSIGNMPIANQYFYQAAYQCPSFKWKEHDEFLTQSIIDLSD